MDLLIAGGGPAALEGALAVQRLAGERVKVTILSDSDELCYRPVSVAEPFGLAVPQRFSLARIAAERGFSLRLGRLRAVDAEARCVRTDAGDVIPYDALLLALGARPEEAVPGALTFRGPEDTTRLRVALERLHAGEPLRVAFVAAQETAWTLPLYELALLTARWADERGLALEPWLVTWEHTPLTAFGEQAGSAVAELLADAGGSGPPPSRNASRTAACGSASKGPCPSTSRWPCRGRSACASRASRTTCTGSSPWTGTVVSRASTTSMPPAT